MISFVGSLSRVVVDIPLTPLMELGQTATPRATKDLLQHVDDAA